MRLTRIALPTKEQRSIRFKVRELFSQLVFSRLRREEVQDLFGAKVKKTLVGEIFFFQTVEEGI